MIAKPQSKLDQILENDNPTKADFRYMYELLMDVADQIVLRDQTINNLWVDNERLKKLLKRKGKS